MADESTLNQETAVPTDNSDTATENLTLPLPASGQTETVSMEAGQIVEVPFDITNQTIVLAGDDLRIEFENGAALVLEDFAALADQGEAPLLLLVDGSVVPGDILLTALTETPEETAAGEGPAGGGSSEYGDDLGDALTGIDKLGVQDPDPFGGGLPQALEDEQTPLESVVDTEAQDISIAISDTQTTISEEAEETDTFTITLSEAIKTGNVVTVKVGFTVNTETSDVDFTTPPPQVTTTAAEAPAGVSFDKATGILTFTDQFVGTELSFTLQAKDDDDVETSETLTITLSDPTAFNGTAPIS